SAPRSAVRQIKRLTSGPATREEDVMRCSRRLGGLGLLGSLLLLPGMASAQSTIAGAVRDTTGAILPGVTVEVSSPVLLEKIRTAVTDGQGRYSIVELRPGIYVVTFSLTGFRRVSRQGIEVV